MHHAQKQKKEQEQEQEHKLQNIPVGVVSSTDRAQIYSLIKLFAKANIVMYNTICQDRLDRGRVGGAGVERCKCRLGVGVCVCE